jgi:hypothetical protein
MMEGERDKKIKKQLVTEGKERKKKEKEKKERKEKRKEREKKKRKKERKEGRKEGLRVCHPLLGCFNLLLIQAPSR